ncbi:MAG: Lectin C-type domain [Myxococcales bacterium]|nr:Lectin C-type domain [Myxococcales bacterium]
MKLFALLAALSGCDVVFDLGPVAPPVSKTYDRCAPGGYDDPLRYTFVSTTTLGASDWSAARIDCQRRGMDLAVFNDVHEMGMTDATQWPYWFGVSQADGADWTTVDGCPAIAMPTPAAAHGVGPMCGAMFDALTPNGNTCDGLLAPNPDGPTQIQGALCETPRPKTADCLPKDPTLEIYTVSPTAITYEAARKFCADLGDHLLVVDSQRELGIVSNLVFAGTVTSPFWIGATFDGTWTSVTQCPAEFSWTDLGPLFVGDPFPNCAGAVIEPDDSGALTLRGMALAKCDATKLAVCESD